MMKHEKHTLKKSVKVLQKKNIYTLFMRNATLSKKNDRDCSFQPQCLQNSFSFNNEIQESKLKGM